jgi:hypothetical protein
VAGPFLACEEELLDKFSLNQPKTKMGERGCMEQFLELFSILLV